MGFFFLIDSLDLWLRRCLSVKVAYRQQQQSHHLPVSPGLSITDERFPHPRNHEPGPRVQLTLCLPFHSSEV